MNTALLIAVLWLVGMFGAWAFVHGAQKLRRQEAAALREEAQ